MQNRYIGDVGDFGKYGLLQALCTTADGNPKLSLGVVWYLTYPNQQELSRDDGKYRSYLNNPQEFRDCAPELFDQMLIPYNDLTRRNISVIPSLGILPSTTVYYDSPLSFSKMPKIGPKARDTRLEHRRLWFDGAMKAIGQADAVFLDPDNGLQTKSVHPYNDNGPKYVSDEELSTFLKRDDKCLILYQHGWREKQFTAQCLRRVGESCEDRDPFALLYRRGTQRVFVVAPCKRHHAILLERSERFIKSRWKEHFEPRVFRIE